MKFWGNLIGYQLVWFIAVIGASHGHYWPALSCGVLFVVWQISTSPHSGIERRLLLVALVIGSVVDGGLALSGLASYATPAPAFPVGGAPLWILVLWASFAMTLNQTLVFLRERPALAAVFGAIGAPLAYLSAARGWHVVQFAPPEWRGLAWLAIGWAIGLPVLTKLAKHWAHANDSYISTLREELP